MYHGVSFALEFRLAVVRPLDGSLASNLPTRCLIGAVRIVCSPMSAFRPSETISYPFTCYEHVIAKAMGVVPMVCVDYWPCISWPSQARPSNPTPSGATTTLLLCMHTSRVRSNMNGKQQRDSLWLLTAAHLGLT